MKLLKTDLVPIRMSRKETWRPEITTYLDKKKRTEKKEKKAGIEADQVLLTAPVKRDKKTTKARGNNQLDFKRS